MPYCLLQPVHSRTAGRIKVVTKHDDSRDYAWDSASAAAPSLLSRHTALPWLSTHQGSSCRQRTVAELTSGTYVPSAIPATAASYTLMIFSTCCLATSTFERPGTSCRALEPVWCRKALVSARDAFLPTWNTLAPACDARQANGIATENWKG